MTVTDFLKTMWCVVVMLFSLSCSVLGQSNCNELKENYQPRIKRQEPAPFFNMPIVLPDGTKTSISFSKENFDLFIYDACRYNPTSLSLSLNCSYGAIITFTLCSDVMTYSHTDSIIHWSTCKTVPSPPISDNRNCKTVYREGESCFLSPVSVNLGSDNTLEIQTFADSLEAKYCGDVRDIIINDGNAEKQTTVTVIEPSANSDQGNTSSSFTTPLSITTKRSELGSLVHNTPSAAASILATTTLNETGTLDQTQETHEDSDKTPIIIGAVLGAFAVVAITVVIVVALLWGRKKQKAATTKKETDTSNRISAVTGLNDHIKNGHNHDMTYVDVDEPNDHAVDTYSSPTRNHIQRPDNLTYTEIPLEDASINDYETTPTVPAGTNNDNSTYTDALYSQVVKPASKNVYAKLHEEVKGNKNPYDMLPDPKDDLKSRQRPPIPKKPKLNSSSDYEMVDSTPETLASGTKGGAETINGARASDGLVKNLPVANQSVGENEGAVNPAFHEDEGPLVYATVCKTPKNEN